MIFRGFSFSGLSEKLRQNFYGHAISPIAQIWWPKNCQNIFSSTSPSSLELPTCTDSSSIRYCSYQWAYPCNSSQRPNSSLRAFYTNSGSWKARLNLHFWCTRLRIFCWAPQSAGSLLLSLLFVIIILSENFAIWSQGTHWLPGKRRYKVTRWRRGSFDTKARGPWPSIKACWKCRRLQGSDMPDKFWKWLRRHK